MKHIFGLTGGIATGKSTALEYFRTACPSMVIFDADRSVRRFLEDSAIVSQIADLLETSIQKQSGQLDRAKLRELIFADSQKREQLESFLHPKVRKECLEKREEWLTKKESTLFVADVPLLFEGGFDFDQELNFVVATSVDTQRSRLKARNHFDDGMITSILSAQLPIMEKVTRADVVFWNEGPKRCLESQIAHFLDALEHS